MKTLMRSNQLLIAIGILSLILQQQAGHASQTEVRLEFHVVTDRTEYAPGSRVSIRSFVLNAGTTPVYVARNFSSCTGWDGYINIQILNPEGRDVRKLGCAIEYLPMTSSEIMETMKNPKLWIRLGPYEIYGTMDEFELPKYRGIYRIKAELLPPRLSEEQKQALNQHQLPFLSSPLTAPVTIIQVK
ncbi:MAG TPA: hypothetical protein VJW20_16740 [Candidatus Angelobacter sp.]|nr:hypothetical protein [Candidatus Angelobacter sp.]